MNNQAAITPAGIEAIKEATTDIDTLQAIVLVMVLPKPVTAVELVARVRRHHEMYAFVDVKYIAEALAQLEHHGYVTYKGAPVQAEPQRRLSRRERRRSFSYGS